jgi:hypothetical protein
MYGRANWGDDHEDALSWCRVRDSGGFRLSSFRFSILPKWDVETRSLRLYHL